jgi:hypothetical protein
VVDEFSKCYSLLEVRAPASGQPAEFITNSPRDVPEWTSLHSPDGSQSRPFGFDEFIQVGRDKSCKRVALKGKPIIVFAPQELLGFPFRKPGQTEVLGDKEVDFRNNAFGRDSGDAHEPPFETRAGDFRDKAVDEPVLAVDQKLLVKTVCLHGSAAGSK